MAACLGVCSANAQNVGPGEQRFNEPVYKGSHNSYDRDESLAEQIDSYNVWQLELDICDVNGDLKVSHTCDPATVAGADLLSTLLTKLQNESTLAGHPFAVIYLDMKGGGQTNCTLYCWGAQIKGRMKTAFLSSLAAASIYPSCAFVGTVPCASASNDASSWPSYQTLTNRGYRWAVIVDWHDMTPPGADQDDTFFEATSTNPPVDSAVSASTVLVNLDGGCNQAPGPTSVGPGLKNNRWLYRAYPDGGCSEDCSLMDGAYWANAINLNYNFVATNCINYDDTFAPPTHTADPLYVGTQPGAACPNSYKDCEWGTVTFPFHNLAAALDRASPSVTVLVAAGTYQVSSVGHPRVLTRLKLRASGGPVILR